VTEIPAYYMRGGASKAVLFLADDLPADPGARDAVLLRVLGLPEAGATLADGLGCAAAGLGRVALVRASHRAGCDVDYQFGVAAVVADAAPRIDWSGDGGDLPAAVGAFAIWRGFVPARASVTTVRMWHENTARLIVAHVPCRNGHPLEAGGAGEEAAPHSAASIALDFPEQAPAGRARHVDVSRGARRLMTGLVHVPERC